MANLNDFRISIQVIFRLFFGCLCERLDENIFDGFTRFSVSYVNFWRPQKGSTFWYRLNVRLFDIEKKVRQFGLDKKVRQFDLV
jgi:hypothetical protein